MTIPFDIHNTPINWEHILRASSIQSGGGDLVGYKGLAYQRGHGLLSFLRSLFRIASPIAKSALKNVAKEGLTTAVAVGSDALAGRNVKQSLKEHGK